MNCKIIKYTLYIVFFFSACWGIMSLQQNQMIEFNIVNFIFAVLFLLTMILISIISVCTYKNKIALYGFLCYWISIVIIYNTAEVVNIKWLTIMEEFMILPFHNIFYILWNVIDGETATAISLLCAYYFLPIFMIIYFSIMILIWKNKKKKVIQEGIDSESNN